MNYIAYLNCFLLLYTAFVGQKDCNKKKHSNNKLSFLTPFTIGKKCLEKPLKIQMNACCCRALVGNNTQQNSFERDPVKTTDNIIFLSFYLSFLSCLDC